jgi:preprotein translocase subunit SecG
MRPRTFILLILVLVVAAVAVLFLVLRSQDGGPLASLLPGGDDQAETVPTQLESGLQRDL